MSLEHAILGFLNYEPMTGYDLKKMIDQSIAHFWPAVQSQVYRTLDRMETAGRLESDILPQESRPPRRLYRITATGREELLRWLQTPLPAAQPKIAWLIQVFFAGRVQDEQIIALLEHQLDLQRKRIARFSAIYPEQREQMSDDDPRERFFWMLTVDYGLSQARAQAAWLERVIRRVKDRDYRLHFMKEEQP